jgi:hypothetical protein
MFDVMESVRHGPLEGSPDVFKTKRKFPISEHPPREDEGCFMLISW